MEAALHAQSKKEKKIINQWLHLFLFFFLFFLNQQYFSIYFSFHFYIYLYRGLADDHRGHEDFYCHFMLEFLCKENNLIKRQDVRTSNSGVREP